MNDATKWPHIRQTFDDNSVLVMEKVIINLPLSVIIVNEEMEIEGLNPWAQKMFGPENYWKELPVTSIFHSETDPEIFHRHLSNKIGAPLYISMRDYRDRKISVRMYATNLDKKYFLFLHDNPEMIALEEELRNFKIAINSADDAIFIFDPSGKIFYTNPAFENQVGLPYTNILGSELKRFWGGKESDFNEMWSYITRGENWAGEIECHCSNNSSFEVEVRITPIYNETKQIVAHICVQRNISHRKELEKKLEDYSQNLENKVEERTEALSKLHEIAQLFHSSDTLDERIRLVLIAATAGETFRFNRAFLLLTNPDKTQLEGCAAIGPADPEEAGKIWQNVQSLPRDGTLAGALQSYLGTAANRDVYVNQIVHRLSTSMDDDKSILIKALKNDRCYKVEKGNTDTDFDRNIINLLGCDTFVVVPLLVSGTPIGILLVDNAITQRYISEEDMTMLDILAAQAALAIAHGETLEELAKKVEEAEYANTELRRSQQQLIETSKFAALGQMAATVAHEIRTPLVAIGGFANMLLRKHHEGDDCYNYLNIIRDESLRLEDVLNRLLFYARPSTPLKEPVNINKLIKDVLHFMESELKLSDVHVDENLDSNLPIIPLDKGLMRQVFINIIQNAIQSMENGGKLLIKTYHQENEIIFVVRDHGVGIPPENIGRVFEPFYSTKHAGTGLGLHVSQRIVVSHGGTLDVESDVDFGTRVTIRLPREEAK